METKKISTKDQKIKQSKKTKKSNKSPVQQKVSKLIKKIILLFILFGIFSSGLFYITKKIIKTRTSYINEINNLEKHYKTIKNKIIDLEEKSTIAMHHIKIWKNQLTPGQKEKKGISMDYAKTLLENLRIQNRIYTPLKINFTVPIAMKGIFDKQNIKVISTLMTIEFGAITDVDVYNFINSIEQEIAGYIVLEEVTLQRIKKVDKKYLESLKKGTKTPILKVKIKIRWYGIESTIKELEI